MKKSILTMLVLTLGVITANAQTQNTMANASLVSKSNVERRASIQFEESNFNFNSIPQGKPVEKVFEFSNSGTAPLLISNVQSSCGCTVADYTKEAIAPGKNGFVKLTFNAANKGQFSKNVTITANTTEGTHVINIRGNVE